MSMKNEYDIAISVIIMIIWFFGFDLDESKKILRYWEIKIYFIYAGEELFGHLKWVNFSR